MPVNLRRGDRLAPKPALIGSTWRGVEQSRDFASSNDYFDEREHVMTEKVYANPVWSYPDSMGPAIYYGHTPEFNGVLPPYKGRQTSGTGSTTNPAHWTAV